MTCRQYAGTSSRQACLVGGSRSTCWLGFSAPLVLLSLPLQPTLLRQLQQQRVLKVLVDGHLQKK